MGNHQTSQGHTQVPHFAADLFCCLRQSTLLLPVPPTAEINISTQISVLSHCSGKQRRGGLGRGIWAFSCVAVISACFLGRMRESLIVPSSVCRHGAPVPTPRGKRDVTEVWEPLGTGIYGGQRLQFADRTSFFLP